MSNGTPSLFPTIFSRTQSAGVFIGNGPAVSDGETIQASGSIVSLSFLQNEIKVGIATISPTHINPDFKNFFLSIMFAFIIICNLFSFSIILQGFP